MKIQTMSVVVGSKACNASCPYCISRTTGDTGLIDTPENINWRNFHIACRLADRSGVNTILLTGKGEPTLYPKLIEQYLNELSQYNFPFIELQTNGITIGNKKITDDDLKYWYNRGLTTISISMVHYKKYINKTVYQPILKDEDCMNLDEVVERINNFGFTVRLSCIMLDGCISSTNELSSLIDYCKTHKVKQLTIRPMTAPENTVNKVTEWIKEHHLTAKQVEDIDKYLKAYGNQVLELPHGAIVYDVDGQNVCWTNCLTTNKTSEDIRQIIYFPDGSISYDWKYTGSVLL